MITTPSQRLTRRAILAAGATAALGGCSFGGRTPTPRLVPEARSYPDATRPDLLISTTSLVERLADDPDNTRILDVRPIRDYRAGHIQMARHTWWQDTIERNDRSYGTTLKPDDETGAQSRRLDVLRLWDTHPGQDVIVYDDFASVKAARLVWFLAFLGFPRVAMLDGGYADWLARDIGSIETPNAIGDIIPASVTPRDGFYLLYEQVLNRLAEGNTVLLDIRTEEQLRDTVGGTVRPGMIPGAISWPWTDLLDGDRVLRPAPELSARAAALGLLPTQRIILVGRFATDCALSWLALQLIGFPDVPTYDGGWMDWSTRPGASVRWL